MGALSVLSAPKAAWMDEVAAARLARPDLQQVREGGA